MSLQELLHSVLHLCANILATLPINPEVAPNPAHKFGSNDPKSFIQHDLNRTAVLREAVVWLCAKILCDLTEFLDELLRIEAAVMIAGDGKFLPRRDLI